jgi:hypothetical protein
LAHLGWQDEEQHYYLYLLSLFLDVVASIGASNKIYAGTLKIIVLGNNDRIFAKHYLANQVRPRVLPPTNEKIVHTIFSGAGDKDKTPYFCDMTNLFTIHITLKLPSSDRLDTCCEKRLRDLLTRPTDLRTCETYETCDI